MHKLIVLILGLLMLPASTLAASVNYRLAITQPQHHLAEVEVQFPQTDHDTLMIKMPNWRSGRYQLLPLADGVRRLQVTDAQGQPLEWQKVARGSWRVALTAPTRVTVRYQLYANELGDRSRHIDDSHGFLDASGVFMYSPEFRDQPLRVELSVPEAWRSVSGMDSPAPHQFVADNYDVLVDSPIETGVHQSVSFALDGRDYQVLFWGEGNYDVDAIVEDLRRLVAEGAALWGGYPYERYVFMIHATSGARGATEHLNSTVIQRTRNSFRKREQYLPFIATASHEFVHTWNVKAYRPAGLTPYDYQQENYTRLLWLAEGSTSYFQNQLLLRAGVITVEEFLQDVARRIERSEATPGRQWQSVAEASFNEWIATGGDYARNHSVNIYSEGYLASWALDLAIIDRTDADKSYRDLHRYLYQNHRLPDGFTEQDVKDGLRLLTGTSFEPWWQQAIDSPNVLDFDAMLAQVGLQRKGSDQDEVAELGLKVNEDQGLATVTHVRRDGPAWQAGLTTEDRVVAINGMRVPASQWQDRLAELPLDVPVSLTLFRRDRLMTLSLTPERRHPGKLVLEAQADVSPAQKAAFRAWAGIDWPY
ncbi:M61 family metallopeptidase [Ferrimonas kyonanensis]|uniref:M61 family metallopeptidase n=1 Tax=Ferrimonas kyonanensis TaxID=364763 RepID=UPI00041E4416|nr:PDZ domain-containing protein [Ferrimonas kyonanensis]